MEKNTTELTLGQRLAADTPTFFKKVEFIGLGLLAIGGALAGIAGLPVFLIPALMGAGTTLTVISKFAVKDTSVLANPNATIQDYAVAAAELPKQIAEIKTGIANTVEAIKTGEVKPEIPVSDTPIVKDIPIILTRVAEPVMKSFTQTLGSGATEVLDNTIADAVSKVYTPTFEGTSPLPNASAMGNTSGGSGN